MRVMMGQKLWKFTKGGLPVGLIMCEHAVPKLVLLGCANGGHVIASALVIGQVDPTRVS